MKRSALPVVARVQGEPSTHAIAAWVPAWFSSPTTAFYVEVMLWYRRSIVWVDSAKTASKV